MRARLLVVAAAALVAVPGAGAGIVTHVGDVFTVPAPSGPLPDLRPLTLLGRDHDRLVLQCLDAACAPPRRIAVRGLPEIVLRPRATTSEVAHPAASFRRETALPPARYRVERSTARWVALSLAALLAVVASVLLRPRRTATAWASSLERALALLRTSASRDERDRRRALDLVGRTANDRDAVAAAWKPGEPTPESVLALADRIEAAR